MSISTDSVLRDNLAITKLLNDMAWAEDTLDWALFESCWITSKPLEIDMSAHLAQYAPDLKIYAADLARTAHLQLSGFDGTHHVLSNFSIDIDGDGTRARARAYVTAYHALHRPGKHHHNSVLVRGTWQVNCVKDADGQWKAVGIRVARLVGAEGDERLYDLARQKGDAGNGRKALTQWTERS